MWNSPTDEPRRRILSGKLTAFRILNLVHGHVLPVSSDWYRSAVRRQGVLWISAASRSRTGLEELSLSIRDGQNLAHSKPAPRAPGAASDAVMIRRSREDSARPPVPDRGGPSPWVGGRCRLSPAAPTIGMSRWYSDEQSDPQFQSYAASATLRPPARRSLASRRLPVYTLHQCAEAGSRVSGRQNHSVSTIELVAVETR
jgi:hypothetical protein